MEALGAQRHVLLEKPVTVEPASAERIAAAHAAMPNRRVLAVAENAQFWPEVHMSMYMPRHMSTHMPRRMSTHSAHTSPHTRASCCRERNSGPMCIPWKHLCVWTRVRVDMRVDKHIDKRVHMFVNMRVGLHIDMRIDMDIDMCTDMRIDMHV